jgi:heat shock protein HtpX
MATLYQDSDANKRKTWILMSSFFILVILIGYAISWYFNSQIILIIAVLFSFISSFVSYWWSDKIVLGMSNAKLVDHDNGREIYHLVENLCITAGLPLPKIYIIEDSAPNAFATGRDPEHAAIALTTGILAKLDKAELEGVIAHELSHIGNRDILISTIATVLVGTVVLITDFATRSAIFGSHRDSDNNSNNNVVGFIIILVLSILAPLSAQLLQLAVSRKREFLADASGALLTRYPEGLARALEKISSDREPLEVANRATAHMYIVSPLKGDDHNKKISWLTKAFMTHPPIEERVARLRGLEIK